jgi:hypothetical protein
MLTPASATPATIPLFQRTSRPKLGVEIELLRNDHLLLEGDGPIDSQIKDMSEPRPRQLIFTICLPLLVILLVSALSSSLLQYAITGKWFGPPTVTVIHSVDIGVSRWIIDLR